MRAFVLTLVSALLLGACQFAPTPPSNAEIAADMHEFESRDAVNLPSQEPDQPFETQWKDGARTLEIHFAAPQQPARLPLIIYLPGLGESARSGGALWRESWVKAGYAVLTLQSERDARAFKSLSHEDQSDLHLLGRQRFSAGSLQARIKDLLYALGKLQALKKNAPFDRWDGKHVILAGYELGAQTVAALVGEKTGAQIEPLEHSEFEAAILISPFLDLAAGGMKSRFDNVTLPLLVVTGTHDSDPFGITSPSLRSAIFSQSQPGGKYLLELHQGTHLQLAGIDPEAVNDEDSGEVTREMFDRDQHPSAAELPGSGRKNGSQVRASGPHDPIIMDQSSFSPRQIGQQLALIKKVSVMFLDAISRKDPEASRWLSEEAQRLGKRLAVFRSR